MNRSAVLIVAITMAFGLAALQAQAQTTWTEPASGGFGTATLPPDAQEWYFSSFGAGTYYWDRHGRVIANADVTTNTVNPGSLTQIVPRFWLNTDADLFKIQVVDPANFTAHVVGATHVLALFAEDGTALAASRGGGTDNAISGAALNLTAGQYFIGIAQAPGAAVFGEPNFGVPRNDANQPLFDFTTDGVKLPIAQADMKLATDPFIAWTINNGGTHLIGPSTFTAPGGNINLTGADFSVVPEPASATLLGIAAAALLRRRSLR